MAHTTLLEEHARESAGMPEAWVAWKYEAIRDEKNECIAIKVTGAVCPTIQRGKRKGSPNFGKADGATNRVVTLGMSSHNQWCDDWEKRTGKCQECLGDGQVFKSWDRVNGVQYKPCQRCKP